MITVGDPPSLEITAVVTVDEVPVGPAMKMPPLMLPPSMSALPDWGFVLVVVGVMVPAADRVSRICSELPILPVTRRPSAPAPMALMLPLLPMMTSLVTSPAILTPMIGGEDAVSD